jgi:hypothetical protein
MNKSLQLIPRRQKNFLRDFLRDIAWPAMAGNVAWAFFSVAIDPQSVEDMLPRLGTLLALALYLSAEWYRIRRVGSTLLGLWFDLFLVICIVWFAIATQANKGAPGMALVLIFLGVGIGHLRGVWPPTGEGKGNFEFGQINLWMAALLFTSLLVVSSWQPWVSFFAVIIVFLFWLNLRHGKAL